MSAARENQRARWFQNGQCIDCGWMLEDAELSEGLERCGQCEEEVTR